MTDLEKRLRRNQENILVAQARKALDEGNPSRALSLVNQTTEFWTPNLVTIMSVIAFQSPDEKIKQHALVMFKKHLEWCTNAGQLVHLMLWVLNPKRRNVLPSEFGKAIIGHRKSLEPGWNGVWENPGTGPTNQALVILTKSPDSVTSIDECLIAASQTANCHPWLNRYRTLGGSEENPRYLKIWAAKAVSLDRKPAKYVIGMLKKFTQLGSVREVRRFFRNNTPTRRTFGIKSPNHITVKCVLLLYCECERLSHTLEDWIHIAKSSIYVDHPVVERMVMRILAELVRTPAAQEVFDTLLKRNGKIPVSQWAREDIGLRCNVIWNSVYPLVPVNADARRILRDYSRFEIETI